MPSLGNKSQRRVGCNAACGFEDVARLHFRQHHGQNLHTGPCAPRGHPQRSISIKRMMPQVLLMPTVAE